MSDPKFIPIVELVKARLREFYREPAIVFWVFVFPLLMALGLGVAFRSKPQPAPAIGVVKVVESPYTEKLAQSLLHSDRVTARVLSADAAEHELSTSQVELLVKLNDSGAQFRLDPQKDASESARLISDDVLQRAAGRKDALPVSTESVTEPGTRYIDWLIPGLIGMNLMGSSMWGVGYNLVVARKRRLLRRYAVTPMRRTHFLLSYFLSRALFLTLELSMLVGFGVLMFGTNIQGSLLAFVVVAVLGAASFAGISLIIGARLDNTETANGWMNFVQLPMYVLAGAFFPYQNFPEWMHAPIGFLPLAALNDGLRAIYNQGATMTAVLPQMAVLAAWGLIGFVVAVRSFRWQ